MKVFYSYLANTLFLSFLGNERRQFLPSAEKTSTAIGCRRYLLLCTSRISSQANLLHLLKNELIILDKILRMTIWLLNQNSKHLPSTKLKCTNNHVQSFRGSTPFGCFRNDRVMQTKIRKYIFLKFTNELYSKNLMKSQ